MWSYYAQSHTGVVLHFDATQAPIGIAQPVVYRDSYPQLPVPPPVGWDESEIARRCLLTKSKEWGHEQEFRLIDYPNPPHGRVLDGIVQRVSEQVVRLPLSHVTGMTLGVRMKTELQDHLIALARHRVPTVDVWQARLEHSTFAMRFDRVEVSGSQA